MLSCFILVIMIFMTIFSLWFHVFHLLNCVLNTIWIWCIHKSCTLISQMHHILQIFIHSHMIFILKVFVIIIINVMPESTQSKQMLFLWNLVFIDLKSSIAVCKSEVKCLIFSLFLHLQMTFFRVQMLMFCLLFIGIFIYIGQVIMLVILFFILKSIGVRLFYLPLLCLLDYHIFIWVYFDFINFNSVRQSLMALHKGREKPDSFLQ